MPLCGDETARVTIIGHSELPVDTLTVDELKNIFKGKMALWDNKQKINFVLLQGGRFHDHFIRRYIRKTPRQYNRYWQRLVFSGRGYPPVTFGSEKEVLAYVESTPGSIGYIKERKLKKTVKIISIIDR